MSSRVAPSARVRGRYPGSGFAARSAPHVAALMRPTRRSVPEVRAELRRAVSLVLLRVRDRDTEALLAACRDRERIGGRVSLVGQLAVQRAHVDPEPHVVAPA